MTYNNITHDNLLHSLIHNEAAITDRLKYSILQKGCAVVHFLLILIFAAVRVYPMVIFNVVSTVIYICCGRLLKNERFIMLYYISFAEVCIHSFAATLLVGWGPGFPLYIIAVTPVIFYMHFSLKKNSMLQTFVIGICSALCFILCKILSWQLDAPYDIGENAEVIIYIFNSVITFSMLLFFSMMFLREMKSSHDNLEQENAELEKISGMDALTGLYNRRSMDRFLKKADVSGRVYTMIMCDIDNFKKVNDTYGHEAGDVVLKNVSQVIVSVLRETDYVCRWGGEEILILASGTPLSVAKNVADRIRRTVERTDNVCSDTVIHCTLTIGAAESSEATGISDVINLADERLYRGKNSGKNVVVSE